MARRFEPGEAYQFDWSHEVVLIDGVTVTVKVAHMRLCHSRMPFVRAYPRETQEMVFDAHDRAFAFYKGACTRGIYDNMKTAVDTVFVGKERAYNRRFLQMCSHYLVDPVACTPAAGWEKGQVENQVGTTRERLFAPRVRVKSMAELNDWLPDQGVARAKVQPHPEIPGKTVWEVFQGEPSRRHWFKHNGECGRAWCPVAARSTASTRCRRSPMSLGPLAFHWLTLEDLPRALRQQRILGGSVGGRPPGGGARRRRPDRVAPG